MTDGEARTGRALLDSVEELSGSALLPIEDELPTSNSVSIVILGEDLSAEPDDVTEKREAFSAGGSAYDESTADPTVRTLPDFAEAEASLDGLDRSETVTRKRPQPLAPRTVHGALPPVPQLPKARPKTTLLPPRGSLPPIPKLPPAPRSLPALLVTERKRDTEPPSRPRVRPLPRELTKLTPTRRRPRDEPRRLDADDGDRISFLPVTQSVPAEASTSMRRQLGPVAAGALAGAALFVGALAWLGSAREGRAHVDSLVVSVAGPGNTAIDSAAVYVDGVRRCDVAPCRVSGLERGLHFVSAGAPGYSTASPRVVRIANGDDALLHLELSRDGVPPVSAKPLPSTPAEPVSNASAAARPEMGLPSPALPLPPPPSRSPAALDGTLNLNSIPVAGVLVDGQPLGLTPRVGVKVKPGSHVVVFVHPEEGRRARAVNVAPGAQQTVAIRF